MESKNYIYELYDLNGELLYIGKTQDFSRRLRQHLKTKEWSSEIFSIYLAECANATEMDIYELYYIGKLKPKYNKDCAHETDEVFQGELKGLDFKHYFLVDYLAKTNKTIISPMEIYEKNQKTIIKTK